MASAQRPRMSEAWCKQPPNAKLKERNAEVSLTGIGGRAALCNRSNHDERRKKNSNFTWSKTVGVKEKRKPKTR